MRKIQVEKLKYSTFFVVYMYRYVILPFLDKDIRFLRKVSIGRGKRMGLSDAVFLQA